MPCAFSRTGRTKLWQSVLAWFLSSSRFAILFCNQGTVRSKCRSVVSLWACEGIHFKEPALWPFFVAFFSFQIEGIAWYRRISWIPTSVDHANGCLLPRHCHLCRRVEKRSGLVTKTTMSQGRDPPIHQFLSTFFVVRLLRLSEEAFFIDGNVCTYISYQGFPRRNVSCKKEIRVREQFEQTSPSPLTKQQVSEGDADSLDPSFIGVLGLACESVFVSIIKMFASSGLLVRSDVTNSWIWGRIKELYKTRRVMTAILPR